LKVASAMLEHVLVENPNGDDLEFDGELVVDERHHDVGFVKIWKTKGGRYVLHQNRPFSDKFPRLHRVERLETVQDLSEALGHSRGAKAVVRKLGLPRTVRID